MNRTINNSLVYSICAAIYLALFVPLVMSPTLFFPFIVGKAYVFRTLVEIAFALYLILVLRDRSYLPKKSLLLWATTAFTAVLGLATIFAESPYRAFWSNFERMEGYVMILHLFALFIAASLVLRGKKVWFGLLNTTLGISIIMGALGFHDLAAGTERIAGTLGNSSYLGVYALLHIFIAGFLLAGMEKGKKLSNMKGISSFYIIIMLFNAAVLYQTGTRGSVAGLAAGALLVTLLIAILEKGMKRKVSIGLLTAMVVVVAFFGAFKNQSFIKNNDLLYRFSSLITTDVQSVLHSQGEARLLLWGVALHGVQERPILGWGQDNFGYVFAKYYNPKMYDQEQWFDRTHDVFFDWLISGGILALVSYLALFYALLYMLWKAPKVSAGENEWSIVEKSIFTGMLLAYFVHNLFVFDNLSSYIIFFLLLSYVAERHNAMKVPSHSKTDPLVANTASQIILAVVIVAVCTSSLYVVVYKPYMAGKDLIYALQPNLVDSTTHQKLSPEDDAKYRLAEIKKALSYNTFGNTEIRERLVDVAANAFSQLNDPTSSAVPQVLKDIDDLVTSEYKTQLAATPTDPRPFIFYSLYLQKVGAFAKAIPYIDKAISLSPEKQSFVFQKGSAQIGAGQYDDAVLTLKAGLAINPDNNEAKILYAISLIYDSKFDEAKTFMGSDTTISADSRVLQAYLSHNRYADIVDIIKTKIAADPSNGQLYMSLAGLYLKLHQGSNAIAQIQQAIQVAPQFAAVGKYYIKEIQAGRDPSTEPTPTQAQVDAVSN